MANAFQQYLAGQQAAMQQGQNALAMQQAVDKIQKDRQLRNILSNAVMPAQSALPEAPAMGPTQPGEVLPNYPAQAAQPARLDTQNALSAMYQGGFGPEAMAFEQKQRTLAGATPSMVNEYKFFSKLTPQEQQRYLDVKRASQIVDIGGVKTKVSPVGGNIPLSTLKKEKKAITEKKAAETKGAKIGAATGTAQAELADIESAMPRLENVVTQLSDLGQKATYTKAGQMRDIAARQAGLPVSESAIARQEYISKVDNEVLPLLRQTFGAAFTEKEGNSLKATLGDPNLSPPEKDAVLRSFIDSKRAQVETKRRRVGESTQQPSAPQSAIDYLMKNNSPAMRAQFKQKYGYLP